MLHEEKSTDNLKILTEMNILLRASEQIDNQMTDEDVERRMVSFIESTQYLVYTIHEGMNIIGYAVIDSERQPPYLRQLFLYEASRSKGIGRRILTDLKEILKTKEIDVEVMAWNTRAVKFYETNGAHLRTKGYRF